MAINNSNSSNSSNTSNTRAVGLKKIPTLVAAASLAVASQLSFADNIVNDKNEVPNGYVQATGEMLEGECNRDICLENGSVIYINPKTKDKITYIPKNTETDISYFDSEGDYVNAKCGFEGKIEDDYNEQEWLCAIEEGTKYQEERLAKAKEKGKEYDDRAAKADEKGKEYDDRAAKADERIAKYTAEINKHIEEITASLDEKEKSATN